MADPGCLRRLSAVTAGRPRVRSAGVSAFHLHASTSPVSQPDDDHPFSTQVLQSPQYPSSPPFESFPSCCSFELTAQLIYAGLTYYTLIWAALTVLDRGSFGMCGCGDPWGAGAGARRSMCIGAPIDVWVGNHLLLLLLLLLPLAAHDDVGTACGKG